MKKLLTSLTIGLVALAFGATAVEASTGAKAVPKQTNINKIYFNKDAANVYAVSIKVNTALTGSMNYVYSPSLFLHDSVLAGLRSDLADDYSKLISSVGAEMAVAMLFEYQATGAIADTMNKLSAEQKKDIDWANVSALMKNQTVIPGRDAGTKVDENEGAIDGKTLEEIDDVSNHDGVYREYLLSSSSSERYGYVDGVLTLIEDINLDLYKVVIHSITATKKVSPLVLDMTGSGKLEASNGQYLPHSDVDFKNTIVADFYGDGFEIAMEWVGPNDGLLVAPKADGTVDMSCLFGTAGGYDTGYEKLSLYADANGIVKGDVLKGLAVWQDKNGNGIADAGEVTSCTELGITSINAKHKAFVSSFEMNGKTQKMWDWWPSAAELRVVAAK